MQIDHDKYAGWMFAALILTVGIATGAWLGGRMDTGQWTGFVQVLVGMGLGAALTGTVATGYIVNVSAPKVQQQAKAMEAQIELARADERRRAKAG